MILHKKSSDIHHDFTPKIFKYPLFMVSVLTNNIIFDPQEKADRLLQRWNHSGETVNCSRKLSENFGGDSKESTRDFDSAAE